MWPHRISKMIIGSKDIAPEIGKPDSLQKRQRSTALEQKTGKLMRGEKCWGNQFSHPPPVSFGRAHHESENVYSCRDS